MPLTQPDKTSAAARLQSDEIMRQTETKVLLSGRNSNCWFDSVSQEKSTLNKLDEKQKPANTNTVQYFYITTNFILSTNRRTSS